MKKFRSRAYINAVGSLWPKKKNWVYPYYHRYYIKRACNYTTVLKIACELGISYKKTNIYKLGRKLLSIRSYMLDKKINDIPNGKYIRRKIYEKF